MSRNRNKRVRLEMKILKYRASVRDAAAEETILRLKSLIAKLEQELREIDQ